MPTGHPDGTAPGAPGGLSWVKHKAPLWAWRGGPPAAGYPSSRAATSSRPRGSQPGTGRKSSSGGATRPGTQPSPAGQTQAAHAPSPHPPRQEHLHDAGLQLLHGVGLPALHGGAHHLPLHQAVLVQGPLVLVQHALLVPLAQVLWREVRRARPPAGRDPEPSPPWEPAGEREHGKETTQQTQASESAPLTREPLPPRRSHSNPSLHAVHTRAPPRHSHWSLSLHAVHTPAPPASEKAQAHTLSLPAREVFTARSGLGPGPGSNQDGSRCQSAPQTKTTRKTGPVHREDARAPGQRRTSACHAAQCQNAVRLQQHRDQSPRGSCTGISLQP